MDDRGISLDSRHRLDLSPPLRPDRLRKLPNLPFNAFHALFIRGVGGGGGVEEEADRSSISKAYTKRMWSYTSTPIYPLLVPKLKKE